MKRFIKTKLSATFRTVAFVVVTLLATFTAVVLMLVVTSCEKNPVDHDTVCPPLRPNIALSPYGWPIWSPDGKTIAFNHTPLKRIYRDPVDCLYYYEFYEDSAGFWVINADGSNQRRVLPYGLGEPDWSPDGKWIVFEWGSQIYKIRVVGDSLDISSLTQLTTEGRNFFPSWSPDGEWIAYDSNLNDPKGGYSIWRMRNIGTDKQLVVRGRMADWSGEGTKIIYIGLYAEIYQYSFMDSSIHRITSFNQVDIYSRDNRYPKFSPDGTKIAFVSQEGGKGLVQLWLMNADGSGLRQLTTEGVGDGFDWCPDGRQIVYVSYRFTDYTFANGTLWILNLETGEKRQLTFNNPPALSKQNKPSEQLPCNNKRFLPRCFAEDRMSSETFCFFSITFSE